MMKRKIAIILVGISLLSLVATGCGKAATANADSIEVAATVESEQEETAVPTASPTEEPTAAPTEASASDGTTASANTSATAEPAATAEPEPTETPVTETPATAAPTATPAPAYTYTDLSATMYAKSAVNVRSLPSTDGERVGGLSTNQEVTVTGQCNETGWYRIDYQGTTAYVSNKYIVAEKIAVTTASNTPTGTTPAAPTAPAGNNQDFWATHSSDYTTWTDQDWKDWSQFLTDEYGDSSSTATGDMGTYTFNRSWAEEIFALVNTEREAAGIPALVWDEDLYNIAMERCKENDIHAGARPGIGENYVSGLIQSAADVHQLWHNSQGHYDNYMKSGYAYGAVAVYVTEYNNVIAYEVFKFPDTVSAPKTDSTAAAPAAEPLGQPEADWLDSFFQQNPQMVSMEVNGQTYANPYYTGQ